MVHSTKGIVLRTIKYGETSVITNIFTEMFGVQSYIVNGVRTDSKRAKAHFFQPSSILDLQVYHNDLRNLQRIKEVKWNYLYKNIFSNVPKNCVALFMVELIHKCLKQPESNQDLFHFFEDALTELDTAPVEITANFPIYFSIHFAWFFGFALQDNRPEENKFFNIPEGKFVAAETPGEENADIETSSHVAEFIKTKHPNDLREIKLNKTARRKILSVMENYYIFHMPEFGKMKTLPVLQEIL